MTDTKLQQIPESIERLIDEVSHHWYLMCRTNQVVLSTSKAMKLPATWRVIATLGGTEQAKIEQLHRHGIEFEQSLRKLIGLLEKLKSYEEMLEYPLIDYYKQHQINSYGEEYKILLIQEEGGSPFTITLEVLDKSIRQNKDPMHQRIRELTEGYVNACLYEATVFNRGNRAKVKSVDEKVSITPEEEYVSNIAKTGGVLNSVMGTLGLITLGANPVSLTCLIGGAIFTAYGDEIAKPLVKACDKAYDKATKLISKEDRHD